MSNLRELKGVREWPKFRLRNDGGFPLPFCVYMCFENGDEIYRTAFKTESDAVSWLNSNGKLELDNVNL